MSTNLNLLKNAIIRLGIVVFLFIASPIIITMGFKGIESFSENSYIYLAYLLVFLGFSGIILSIILAFKAFSILKKALFNDL